MSRPRRSLVPRLSIVLPVLGNPAQMEDSLVSVLENRPDGCEILVVLDQPYDDPYELEEEVRFLHAPSGAGVVDAINCGIAASRAALVHVLPCGVRACEGWCEAALARFDDPRVAAVSPVLLDAQRRDRVVSAGTQYQRWGRVRRLRKFRPSSEPIEVLADPDFAATFYRKSALEQIGPLSGRFGRRLAAVALGLALQDAGFRCILEPSCQMLAANPRANSDNALARGWGSERLFWRRLPPHGRGKWLAMHALLVAAESTTGLVRPSRFLELVGRTAAFVVEQVRPGDKRPARPVERDEPLEGPHFGAAAVAGGARVQSSRSA